jgi:3'(2'), 5'-bisphosphate nucleotidase
MPFSLASLNLQHEVEVASELAKRAGEAIMRRYATQFAVAFKREGDPVTEADLRAHEIIVQGLSREFPEDAVISEEGPLPTAGPTRRVWYVDPLDGTYEFVSRNGEFSVMIGLALEGQACCGVVYRPVDGTLYGGIVDREAWIAEHGRRTRIWVSSHTEPPFLRLAVSRSHRHPRIDEMKSRIGITEEIQCGSVGLKIGLLVRQQADVYLEPSGNTSKWDVCAPEAVLRGASGRLTDLAGDPVVYGGTNCRNARGLVATNGVCHEHVIEAIAPIARAAGLI